MRDRRRPVRYGPCARGGPSKRNFNAAFLADDAAILHALVLAAQAFVILDRTENAGAEQAVPFRLEGTVVDGLRLLDLAVGPRADTLRAGDRDLDLVESSAACDLVRRIFINSFISRLLHLRHSTASGLLVNVTPSKQESSISSGSTRRSGQAIAVPSQAR